MKRSACISLGLGLSVLLDGLILLVAYFQNGADRHVPVIWVFLTLFLAVWAVVPLLEMARTGGWLEKVLAVLFSSLPVGWIGLLAYPAYENSH